MLKNFSSRLKEQGEKVKEKVSAINVPDLGVEKINESLERAKEILPIVKEVGYVLSEMEIEVGVPPAITMHFVADESSKKIEDIENVLSKFDKSNKLGYSILKGLLTALKIQKSLKLRDEELQEIEIGLGIPPKVILHFQKP